MITKGINPYRRTVLVFWKTKSISSNFGAKLGSFDKVNPFGVRRLGTGIATAYKRTKEDKKIFWMRYPADDTKEQIAAQWKVGQSARATM